MIIAKVIGNVWTTQKEKGMENLKLLIVRPIGPDNEFIEDILVAVDRIGAGISETVLITKGSPAQKVCGDQNTPIDAAIVGIVDSYDITELKVGIS